MGRMEGKLAAVPLLLFCALSASLAGVNPPDQTDPYGSIRVNIHVLVDGFDGLGKRSGGPREAVFEWIEELGREFGLKFHRAKTVPEDGWLFVVYLREVRGSAMGDLSVVEVELEMYAPDADCGGRSKMLLRNESLVVVEGPSLVPYARDAVRELVQGLIEVLLLTSPAQRT